MKKKMGISLFSQIVFPLITLLCGVIIATPILGQYYKSSLDVYVGTGKRNVVLLNGQEHWDVNYYKQGEIKNSSDAFSHAQSVAEKIADEGIVLLKNNGILPLAKGSAITPFGYRFISPVYAGAGSGDVNVLKDYVATPEKVFNEIYQVNSGVQERMESSTVQGMLWTTYSNGVISGDFRDNDFRKIIYEYDSTIFDESLKDSCHGTTAVVFLGRSGGETFDLSTESYADGTKHCLRLTVFEKEILRYAKTNCDKLIIIINSSNLMEIGDVLTGGDYEADAVLWMGSAGGRGFKSLVRILCGEINPSGRLPDIWMKDFLSDPVSKNFGRFYYTNGETTNLNPSASSRVFDNPMGHAGYVPAAFLEYEEGIYLGYRFYETVHDTGGRFTVFDKTNCGYSDAVLFPFGYGLSYTRFDQKITSYNQSGNTVNLEITVENTGAVKGKTAVQVYFRPPYTKLDKQYKIEKATVNLLDFAKTKELAPSEKEVIKISFKKEDLASYCYSHINADGSNGCYMLETGDYIISLRADSHTVLDSKTLKINKTVWYEDPRESEITAQSALDNDGASLNYPASALNDVSAIFKPATNQFELSNLYMSDDDFVSRARLMTRAGDTLTDTTTTPDTDDFTASESVTNALKRFVNKAFDAETDTLLGNVPGSFVYEKEPPTANQQNGYVLADMRGLSYYDKAWDELLDQLDYSDSNLFRMLFASFYTMPKISSVGKPSTSMEDGPLGVKRSLKDSDGKSYSVDTVAYPGSPVIAATFNKMHAYEMGDAVGKEAFYAQINFWYAPGLNIHRSPFSGRNFEYYSEDAVLSGKIAAAVCSGAGDAGLGVVLKHAVLNDQDWERDAVLVWANEQTMREIYFKAFEICVKEAKKTIFYTADEYGNHAKKTIRAVDGIMTGKNYIGVEYCNACYSFNTTVLRSEWGFTGFVITDSMITRKTGGDYDLIQRSGVDIIMNTGSPTLAGLSRSGYDFSSPTAQYVLRRAVKNVLYATVSNNAIDGIPPGATFYYDMAPWEVFILVLDIALGVFAVLLILWWVKRFLNYKKQGETK